MEIFVPQMIRVEEPPMASASEVLGSMFEKVAESDAGIGAPFSSTKILRRRAGVVAPPKTSEWMSPRRELFKAFAPFRAEPEDRGSRTKRPLLLLGMLPLRSCDSLRALVGLELEA